MTQTLKTPFQNDPFVLVDMAYQTLFGKPYAAYYDQYSFYDKKAKRKHKKEYGYTLFEDGYVPEIHIFAEHSINNQVETFAHELAHVAVGVDHEHDEVWQKAFDDIFQEYNRLGDEMFGDKTEGVIDDGYKKSSENPGGTCSEEGE